MRYGRYTVMLDPEDWLQLGKWGEIEDRSHSAMVRKLIKDRRERK